MTKEAQTAIESGYRFEAKKDGFSQLQSGTSKISLTINPDELPMDLVRDAMGQRYMVVMVPLNDDETPRQKPKSYAGQAKMLAQDERFTEWLKIGDHFPENNEKYIELVCNVQSCAEIIEGTQAGHVFKKVQGAFLDWKNNPPLSAYETDPLAGTPDGLAG